MKNIHLFSRKKTVALLLLFVVMGASAQNDRDYIRQGNKQFRSGKYAEAEVNYRKALERNAKNPQAFFNLGNALLAQKKDSAAIEQFQQAAKIETSPKRRSYAYHNIGVICQGHQMFGEAIGAYKEALRNNPDDDETRYNLELCKRQQKQQQNNQQNQQNQDNKDKQDKNKDKNKDQNKDQQGQQKQQQKQQQEQKPQMSKDNAEQLLNAAMQEEKEYAAAYQESPASEAE